MGVRTGETSSGGRVLRLVVLLAVLAGLVPGVRTALVPDHGALAGAVHASWSEDCSAPPRAVRVGEQPVVAAVEPSVFVVVCPSPAVVGVRERVVAGSERAWFAVSRAGRAPPFFSGI